MSARAGLVGIYQPPTLVTKSNSVYMISDENNDTLLIFILFPGAYDTAYEVASTACYRNIFIIPVSLDALYISDVVRLVNDLYTKKHIVKVLYPGKFCAYVPVAVQKALIASGRKSYYQYKNGFVTFDFKFTNSDYQPNFHDIYATFRTRRCLFCPFEVNKARILSLLKNNDVDWVYVPYSDPMFGNDSFATLVIDKEFEPYMNKIIAFGFLNETQENYCKARYPMSFPRTIKNAFLRTDPSLDNGMPPVIGGEVDDDVKPAETIIISPGNTPHMEFPPPFPKPKPVNDTPIEVSGGDGEIHIIPIEVSADE